MTQQEPTSNDRADSGQSHGPAVHVMSAPALIAVFLALLVLTGATVAATAVDFGAANLVIALGIATVKALLVALFFMHLAYDRPFNALVFCTAWLFVAVFAALTLLDTAQPYLPLEP